ncbi:MAG: response regulator transcription factor [Treponema sp.]|jgi:DNA-binding NarL/FixJ family response regulator|nr:response regulator transcription factor [Treponema sp.]
MITVAVISNHEDDIRTISALLTEQNDFHITSTGKDGYDALRSAKTQRPDIIIMDFSMTDIDSPELAPIIKRNSPSTALIVLCSHNEQDTVTRAFNAGISGYLLRQDGFTHLASSVRSVFYGGLYISKSVKNHTLNRLSTPAEIFPAEPGISRHFFSSTEQGIFYGISRGCTDREIARNLNISIGSVRNCINQVKKKTGLHNRTQITIYALFSGIINIGKIKDAFLETGSGDGYYA